MTSLNLLAMVSIGYVALLFMVAFWADRQALRGAARALCDRR